MELQNVNSVRERLIEVIEKMSPSPTAFARTYGLDPSYLLKKLNGIKPITRFDIRKMEATPVNTQWLANGEGSMFKDGFVLTSRITPVTGSATKGNGIPLYDVDFALGYVDFMGSESIHPLALVDFPGTRDATCWVKTTGNSMSPAIHSGDYICLKRIEGWDSYLTMGEVYAIETVNDMRTVKKIEKGSSDDTLSLVPVNKSEYETQEVRKDVIRRIFKVVAVAKLM